MKPPPAKDLAFCDVDREIQVTRRLLERLPERHFAWSPHEKSMNLGRLAMHVANLLQWTLDTLELDGLDMDAPPAMRNEPKSLANVLETFDKNAMAVRQAMERTNDAKLASTWTLRQGKEILFSESRARILRVWCLNHLVHHRAQLCVYLRLLDEPVPAIYFNSADEPDWTFN